MRYAVYFTPERDHPLARAAASWLGRDAFTGAPVVPPAVSGLSPAEIAFHTAAARRYGFHATIKAPFRLADGESEASLLDALDAYAGKTAPVQVPRLVIGQIDGFFALLPSGGFAELKAFAASVVTAFDRFRAPITETEIERRNPETLSAEQFRNLCQWGYPYVFDAFRFHMTLSGRVSGGEAARVRAALEEVFEPVLAEPATIDGLAVFVEPEAGGPFTVLSRRVLESQRERKIA
jgi:putative phosphonate metabolism protein